MLLSCLTLPMPSFPTIMISKLSMVSLCSSIKRVCLRSQENKLWVSIGSPAPRTRNPSRSTYSSYSSSQSGRKQLPRRREEPSTTDQPQPEREGAASSTTRFAGNGGQAHFGILTSTSAAEARAITRIQEEAIDGFHDSTESIGEVGRLEVSIAGPTDVGGQDAHSRDEQSKKQAHGQLSSKTVLNPPNLEQWRQKLFDLEDIVVLSHDE